MACREAEERLDGVLDVNLASDDSTLTVVLADIRRERERFSGEIAPCAASLAMNEVVILNLLGRMRESDRVSRATRERYYGVMPVDDQAIFHLNWGLSLARLGETQASTLQYVEAAALSDRLDPHRAATVLLYAALTFNEVGDLSRAASYLREADSTARAHQETEGVSAALGEIELEHAVLYQREASTSASPEAFHSRAIAAARRALTLLVDADYHSPEQAMSHLVIARAEMRRGRYTEAEAALRMARPISEIAKAYTPFIEAERWLTEGELASARGRAAESREAYATAIRVARDARLPSTAIQGLLALAETSEEEGDIVAAEAQYREAVELGETIRQRLGLQDWSLSASDQVARPAESLAALLARQGRAEEAFEVLDGSRARRLLDLRAQAQSRESLPEAERMKLDTLLDALDDARLAIPGASGARRSALDATATRIQAQIADVTGVEMSAAKRLDPQALRDTLEARNQVLVSYLIGQSESWAFVLRPDTLVAVALPRASEPDIGARMQSIGVMWRDSGAQGSGRSGSAPMTVDPEFQLSALEDLYERLVQPIRGYIGDDDGLLVVPGTQLATLPFSMLVAPEAERTGAQPAGAQPTRASGATEYASANYLIRHMPIGTELAAALVTAPLSERVGTKSLVYGRSDFGDRADLPFVRDETRRVRRAVLSPVVRLNDQATEADLVARLPTADIVHIASHASADPDFPLYSQIVLSDDPADPDDGTLHLYELQDEPLAARLVVLSGCSTARGRALRGEGMMGLQYAVRAAGAASTLATLWPVDDRATVEVMGSFYEHLARGLSKDRALQQAQLDYFNTHDGMDASPFYWAPSVLTGDTSPMPGRPQSPGELWGVLLAAIALSASVAWWLTHRRRLRV